MGPRDGLQNESSVLSAARRAELVRRLLAAGVDLVEAVAFVNPARVPQMAGADEVVAGLGGEGRERVTALIPNRRGYDRAVAGGLSQVRCVVAASATMNRKNFGVDPEGTMAEVAAVARAAGPDGVAFGLVVGTAFGCPFEGAVDPEAVLALAARGADLGAAEVVLADTTGMANPAQVHDLARRAVAAGTPRLACHFHNTRNTGFANALRALDAGVRRLDASVGGAGGCPFAPGATGNVATEDLVHMLHAMGFRTGCDLGRLVETATWLAAELGHDLPGQVMRAGPALTARAA